VTLTPADDEAFELDEFITLDGVIGGEDKSYEVWVCPHGDYDGGAIRGNFEIAYSTGKGGHRVIIDMLAEDMERIGVLMQFAAREAMRRKNG
jgi:hypothetical protein